jgi:hypothetical protein
MSYSDIVREFPVTKTAPTLKKYFERLSPEQQDAIIEFCEMILNEEESPLYGKSKTVNHLKKYAIHEVTGGISLSDVMSRISAFIKRATEPGKNLIVHGKRVLGNFKRAYEDSRADIDAARQHARDLITAGRETLMSPPVEQLAQSDVVDEVLGEGKKPSKYCLKAPKPKAKVAPKAKTAPKAPKAPKKGGCMTQDKIGGFAVGGSETMIELKGR